MPAMADLGKKEAITLTAFEDKQVIFDARQWQSNDARTAESP